MEIPVIIERITYRGEKGFAILAANLDPCSPRYNPEMEEVIKDCINKKYDSFTISIGMLDSKDELKGGQYIFVGDIKDDKKFGKQFKADFYYQDIPSTKEGLKQFLCTLPNIKESRSEAIIEKFGLEGTIHILDNDIGKLIEINGINARRIPAIKKSWDEKKYLRDLYGYMVEKGIPVGVADKSYHLWGKEALNVIKITPYRLIEIRGIGFLSADKYAHQIDKNISNEFRIMACIKYILEENIGNNGNLCIPYLILKKNLINILSECDDALSKKIEPSVYLSIVPVVLKANLDTFTLVKDIKESVIYIYLRNVWEKEKYISKSIYERKEFNHAVKKECTDREIETAEIDASKFSGRKIELDETQKIAIKSAFQHKISVITGPAGSGKSMICRCIYSIARNFGMSVRMMTPTGKAAQVLSEKTGCPAKTIHRGLGIKPGEDAVKHLISEDILLIDEVSMCGIDTIYAIIKAIESNKWANIVLVGDKQQLPSVSPGNFLSDIMESGCANIVTLNKVHRQDEGSYIALIANEISKGKFVTIPDTANDIKWNNLHVDDFHEELAKYIDEFLIGKDVDDLQIISPMKKGSCGVFKINEVVQKKMADLHGTANNPLIIGFNKFFVGDRVIQMSNNYDKDVFNGDIGVIFELGEKIIDPTVSDKKERFIIVDFSGEKKEYIGTEIEQLNLAWCCTIHKYQGSQSKYIIFIMADEAQIMMNRELVYTAFTRAAKRLEIFGHENMLRIAPTRSIISKRYTLVKKIIEELRSGAKILDVMEKKGDK